MDFNAAKGICLTVFFLITIVLGTLPLCLITKFKIQLQDGSRSKIVLSFLNCFAGGVFLGTCLLNMFTEGQEQFEEYKETVGFDNEYPFFQAGVGLGFFLIVMIERLVHTPALRNPGQKRKSNGNASLARSTSACGQFVNENFSTAVELTRVTSENPPSQTYSNGTAGKPADLADSPNQATQQVWATGSNLAPHSKEVQMNGSATTGDDSKRDSTQDDHGNGTESSDLTAAPIVRVVLLLGALSFHTIFDGLAVGLQETETGIWSTFVGISIHKAIVALCLGLELTAAIPDKPLRVVLCLLFFALMAPMGVAIGMGVTSGGVNMGAQLLAASILQALATGSFLFVTFLEILGPELRGHDLGIYKVMVATFGFLITAGVKVLDAD
ncbi:hypothetical protein BaRGS_00002796 [Batillaria attramentaria]|uniref:Uncharacterized protein n=1 Tax=Batillaria attramentaria TaxID=370345 RepID=A0ABD0M2D3_9CAEN